MDINMNILLEYINVVRGPSVNPFLRQWGINVCKFYASVNCCAIHYYSFCEVKLNGPTEQQKP